MLKKVKSFFKRQGLKNKILIVDIMALTLALVVVMSTGIWHIGKMNRMNMLEAIKKNNEIVADKMEQVLIYAEHMTDLVANSDTIQKKFNLDDRIEQMEAKYTLSCVINNLTKYNRNLDCAVLYHRTGWTILSNYVNMSSLDTIRLENILNETMEDYGWGEICPRDYLVLAKAKNGLSYYKKIYSIYTKECIGILSVDIPETCINECYTEYESSGTRIYITNGESKVISATQKDMLYRNASEIDTDGFYVTETPVDKLGWNVIRLDERHTVNKTILPEIVIIFLIGLFVEMVVAFVITIVMRRLIRPVDQMVDLMNNPEDSIYLNKPVVVEAEDEIGRLVAGFITMQKRLRILIERIKFEEKQKSRNEMMALQANIKPHFLYNTLESVCALVQMDRGEDAITMLKSIEHFYRGTLSSGRFVISIREELEITKQYLQIQKLKYAGTLNVEIDVDEGLMEWQIPKLTLQPFVENAIYHGLQNSRNGRIRITGTCDGESGILSVEDNGSGFDVSRINPESRKKKHNAESYAISNVVSRLKLCFGPEYGVQIESLLGEGTTVYIRLPMKGKDSER